MNSAYKLSMMLWIGGTALIAASRVDPVTPRPARNT
jgi:hypothetical protein